MKKLIIEAWKERYKTLKSDWRCTWILFKSTLKNLLYGIGTLSWALINIILGLILGGIKDTGLIGIQYLIGKIDKA